MNHEFQRSVISLKLTFMIGLPFLGNLHIYETYWSVNVDLNIPTFGPKGREIYYNSWCCIFMEVFKRSLNKNATQKRNSKKDKIFVY